MGRLNRNHLDLSQNEALTGDLIKAVSLYFVASFEVIIRPDTQAKIITPDIPFPEGMVHLYVG